MYTKQMDLPKNFDFNEAEPRIYKKWQDSGFFNPDNLPPISRIDTDNKTDKHGSIGVNLSPRPRSSVFTIIMPPPNANGSLHIGHALFVTTQDIMIRYKRMRGFKTLWLPGADHAGFETQVVYTKKLEKEGKVGKFSAEGGQAREQLYQEILDFTLKNKAHMESQLRALGASCDWSREKFTLDEDIKKIVYETFEKLYADGLVYRGERIINWCPKHQTSLSDLEIEQPEVKDNFYYLKYGPFTIATARPETKFGDKYVVVHPKDHRYKKYKDGQQFEVEWINGKITATLIKDRAIDMSFGTGAMTITPAHDATDFEISERHKLEKEQIIDWQGKLLPIAGEFAGMHISKARPLIVEKLKVKGLLVKTEEYQHTVPVCYKCHTPIEPQIRPQWFVAMTKKPKRGKSLRDLAVEAIKKEKIKFVTKRFRSDFLRWMKNLRDWNISRQIVWGIRIPAWFHEPKCVPRRGHEKDIEKCQEIIISETEPKCEFCDAKFIQDPDVFDTWFSSGQWPFATLLASGQRSSVKGQVSSRDFETFYPTDVMETGWDILFFWVARMIMLGLYRTGKVPFKTVYLHGLVRDKDRQKMSKSKGNVIDPLGVSEVYGTDAVRMALISGNAAGTDPVITEEKIRGFRNFTTKIWNASRFVLEHASSKAAKKPGSLDKKYLKDLKEIKKKITAFLEEYRLHLASEEIYQYFWHTFADKVIEEAKKGKIAQSTLLEILRQSLIMLHPFMPFVTEEIYQKLPKTRNLLLVEQW